MRALATLLVIQLPKVLQQPLRTLTLRYRAHLSTKWHGFREANAILAVKPVMAFSLDPQFGITFADPSSLGTCNCGIAKRAFVGHAISPTACDIALRCCGYLPTARAAATRSFCIAKRAPLGNAILQPVAAESFLFDFQCPVTFLCLNQRTSPVT